MNSVSTSAPAAIRLTGLGKTFGTSAAPVHALRGITLEIAAGERVAVLGKSGSGKSTLLNLVGGLDRASAGTLEVQGRDLATMSRRELTRHRLGTVGMVFQSFNLIPSRTALQNVELPMVFAGRSPRDRRAAARQALEGFGLGDRLHHRPAELSGGENQRAAIARALVNRPAVLLADEPTGNLDSTTSDQIIALLTAHVRDHATTLVLVTHDEELARAHTDRVVRLHDGQIVS
jgi:predicted ABC-type transport system involved in lysophospholipase L1 biosynthesis ATPase subunit